MLKIYINFSLYEKDTINEIKEILNIEEEETIIFYPEAHMHPACMKALAETIYNSSETIDLSVVTNSYFLMSYLDILILKTLKRKDVKIFSQHDGEVECSETTIQDIENNRTYEIFENLFSESVSL